MDKVKGFALVSFVVVCTVAIAGTATTYIVLSNNFEKDDVIVQPIDSNLE